MNWKTMLRGLFAWSALGFIFLFVIYIQEGISGFKPFLNLEALLIVVVGTGLMLWVSYPARDILAAVGTALSGAGVPEDEAVRLRAILLDAADSAMAAGAAGTVLAMILMLSSISDVSAIPRRTALALASLFFAYVAAEFVLVPLSRRLPCRSSLVQTQPHDPGGPKRQFHGLFSFGMVFMVIMTLMYVLSAALAQT